MSGRQAIIKVIAALHQTGDNTEAIRDTAEQFVLYSSGLSAASDFKKACVASYMLLQSKYKMTLAPPTTTPASLPMAS